jgi:hypothetical protein
MDSNACSVRRCIKAVKDASGTAGFMGYLKHFQNLSAGKPTTG